MAVLRMSCRSCRLWCRVLGYAHSPYPAVSRTTSYAFFKRGHRENANYIKQQGMNSASLEASSPNKFGDLSKAKDWELEAEFHDETKQDAETDFKPSDKNRWSKNRYERELHMLIKERKLAEALEMFEKRMTEDRVRPTDFMYLTLISGCGREGYTKKAFKLFNNMKKRGMVPGKYIYSSLFNACANSPWSGDGLERAEKLWDLMKQKQIPLNTVNYQALMKVYAKHGSIDKALLVMDEMMTCLKIKDDQPYNHLLSACLRDETAGFRHALLIWRVMRKRRIRPSVYSYQLLLQSARECGVGDPRLMNDILRLDGRSLSSTEILTKDRPESEEPYLLSDDPENQGPVRTGISRNAQEISQFSNDLTPKEMDVEENSTELTARSTQMIVPNLLSWKWKPVSDVSIGKVETPQERLSLLGGVDGVLNQMNLDKAQFNARTFTELLQLQPSTTSHELQLVERMDKLKVAFDVHFFNVLLKRRIYRHEEDSAKSTLELMGIHHIQPNVDTYEILASGCHNTKEAKVYLSQLKEAGVRANSVIFRSLFKQACRRQSLGYMLYLMKFCIKEDVSLSSETVKAVEKAHSYLRSLERQRDLDREVPAWFSSAFYQSLYKEFKDYYPQWLKEIEVEEESHPWNQYRKHELQESSEAGKEHHPKQK